MIGGDLVPQTLDLLLISGPLDLPPDFLGLKHRLVLVLAKLACLLHWTSRTLAKTRLLF